MEGGSLSDWLSGLSITSIGIGTFAVMMVAMAADPSDSDQFNTSHQTAGAKNAL